MKLGKMLAALLGAAVVLVAPATVAAASTAPAAPRACAPTDEARWLGTFYGPHTNENNDGNVSDQEIMVHKPDDQLLIRFDGNFWGYAQAWGTTDTGLLHVEEPEHPIMGLESTSAKCDADGDVVSFSGDYYHFYNWPECWGCVSWGTFDVTRTAAVRS